MQNRRRNTQRDMKQNSGRKRQLEAAYDKRKRNFRRQRKCCTQISKEKA